MFICNICCGLGMVCQVCFIILGQMQIIIICFICSGSGQIIKDCCSKCKGDGWIYVEEMIEILILVGVEGGMQFSMCGKGNAGCMGGFVGDLLINIEEKLYESLQCDGMNFIYDFYINFVDVVLGIFVEVLIIDG